MIGPSRFTGGVRFGGALMAVLLGTGAAAPKAALPGSLMFDSPISLSLKGMRHKLNPLAIVNLASDGDRVCEGDKVRSAMSVSQIPGPSCVIARLLPFSRDVEDALPADWAEVSDVQMRKIRLQPTK